MIGYIGLGNMGAPMAERLLDWPDGLVVCDARPDAAAPFAARGALVVASPREVAERASVISIAVLDDTQVREVVADILTSAADGAVVAVHSTISDETAVQLAADCAARGVEFVDAPVSGGRPAAATGALAVMIGGSDTAFAAVADPFRRWANLVVHAGEVGAGTRMKLARNLLHFIAFSAAGEAQRLAQASGLNLLDLGAVVRHSDGITGGPGAIMLRETTELVSPDDFWWPILTHVRDLGVKDLTLALDLAARVNVELPLGEMAAGLLGTYLGVEK